VCAATGWTVRCVHLDARMLRVPVCYLILLVPKSIRIASVCSATGMPASGVPEKRPKSGRRCGLPLAVFVDEHTAFAVVVVFGGLVEILKLVVWPQRSRDDARPQPPGRSQVVSSHRDGSPRPVRRHSQPAPMRARIATRFSDRM
jgi:hypothetical protein